MADEGSRGRTPSKSPVGRVVFRWLRRLFLVGVALAGLSFVAVALLLRHYEEGLPSTEELRKYSPPQVTRILARDGSLLAEDFVERRTVVRLAEIPPQVKLAFLAAEDASFYEHQGLNYAGMLRAMWVNLRSSSARQGGSTITQQVVKNVLLTNERTFERKMKEVLLSRRIEEELTKDEILELYLNYIYFGHGRYGVEEASKYYFGKSVRELSLAEAAVLASIPKGPSRYSPRENMPRALSRHLFVLDQMQEKGFARPEAIDEAKQQRIVLAPEPEVTGEIAPEVVAEARRTLKELVGDDAQKGGYVITTTIDPKLQAEARKALRDNLASYDKRRAVVAPIKKPKKATYFEGDPATEKHAVYQGEVIGADDAKNELFVRVGTVRGAVNLSTAARYNPDKLPASKFAEIGAPVRVALLSLGETDPDGKRTKASLRLDLGPEGALVAIDVGSRDILALAGSYEGLRSGLDRTSQAHRQPGSTFKPIVYSYAIHAKTFTAASLLPTSPSALTGHVPKNYDKSEDGEPTRLREALAKSINVSAQWTAERVGPANVVTWANDLGIESKLGPTPSIALGAYEVTPRELANTYATFAAGGMVEAPRLIDKIVGPTGVEIALPPRAPKKRVMTEAEAFVTTDLLKSVVETGTGQAAKVLRRPIAGKTGTSNEVRDAWFAGYSTQIACVVWTGYDDPAPLGAGEAGARTSLPAFIAFMRAAHQGLPATEFPVPMGVTRVDVDPKTGLLARPDQEDALSEVFLAGTEPKDTAADVDGGTSPSDADAGTEGAERDAGASPSAAPPADEEPPPPPERPDGPPPTEGAAP